MRKVCLLVLFVAMSLFNSESHAMKHSLKDYFLNVYNVERQGDEDEAKRKEHRERWDKALGSFQFQVIDSRVSPSINISIIEKIESSRHKTDTVYIKYADDIRIMVLPYSVINGNYEKLQFIKYISSQN
jgi:hypothetical protein